MGRRKLTAKELQLIRQDRTGAHDPRGFGGVEKNSRGARKPSKITLPAVKFLEKKERADD
jgi:hypothetical protein